MYCTHEFSWDVFVMSVHFPTLPVHRSATSCLPVPPSPSSIPTSLSTSTGLHWSHVETTPLQVQPECLGYNPCQCNNTYFIRHTLLNLRTQRGSVSVTNCISYRIHTSISIYMYIHRECVGDSGHVSALLARLWTSEEALPAVVRHLIIISAPLLVNFSMYI